MRMTKTEATTILADLHSRFGDDAFVELCLHAARADLTDDQNEESTFDPADVSDWCEGLAESMRDVEFGV